VIDLSKKIISIKLDDMRNGRHYFVSGFVLLIKSAAASPGRAAARSSCCPPFRWPAATPAEWPRPTR
jgi:hypothetical protein